MTRQDATAFVESQFKGVELFKSKVAAPRAVAKVAAIETASDTVDA
jgi:hypothetical protein